MVWFQIATWRQVIIWTKDEQSWIILHELMCNRSFKSAILIHESAPEHIICRIAATLDHEEMS